MAPKNKEKGGKKKAAEEPPPEISTIDRPNVLDTLFPEWNEAAIAGDKVDTKAAAKYEDRQGLLLPDAIMPFFDAWKRPENLVLGQPEVPIVSLAEVEVNGKPVLGGEDKRALEGKLFSGNAAFDWLWHTMVAIRDLRNRMEGGNYLWEHIYPQNKDRMPEKRPDGKFYVKCFIMDKWRTVVVDDRMPVDLFGTPLPVGIRPLQLWPLVLSKAVLKIMAAYKMLDACLPDEAPAFEWLTGWPQENLRDALSGASFASGEMFDRIERSLQPYPDPAEREVMTTCVLKNRAKPEKPPPRVIVLYGPSGVGTGRILDKIVADNPVTLGRTIATTTRFPKEHEVEGRDYYFSDLATMRADIDKNQYLEHGYVLGSRGRYLYGSSLATVRTVAATGKLCCMNVDPQGIRAIKKTPGVDGLYIYVAPPSVAELEKRCRGRLKEAESTITKRVQWATQQVKASQDTMPVPGSGKKGGGSVPVVDFSIDNTTTDYVYDELKEAICTLSPIVRNRIRGLPAYVLAYSDLIPSNSVEKPFLKPIMIAGPTCAEKTMFIQMLIKEFPDVFAFARLTTTQKDDEWDYRVEDDFDMKAFYAKKARSQIGSNAASKKNLNRLGSNAGSKMGSKDSSSRNLDGLAAKRNAGGGGLPTMPEGDEDDDDENKRLGTPEISQVPYELYPRRNIVTDEEFDAMVARGEFLEHHRDLFKHAKSIRKWGTTKADCQAVIDDKKLILIDCDMEGLKMVREGGNDCLTIFLNPPSIDEYESRVRSWLTYSDEEIGGMMERAREAETVARTTDTFDFTITNADLEDSVDELRDLISRYRPDLIPPRSEEAVVKVPYLVLCGARGWGCKDMAGRMVKDMGDAVKVAVSYAVRKPKEGEEEGVHYRFLGKPDAFKKMLDKGELLENVQIGTEKDSVLYGVPMSDVEEGRAAGKIIAMRVNMDGVQSLRENPEITGRNSAPLFVYIAPPTLDEAKHRLESRYGLKGEALDAAVEALSEELALARQPVADGGMFDVVLENESTDVAYADLKMLLAAKQPKLVKPPYQPLVVCGPFGTGKRLLLQRLLDEYTPTFQLPKIATSVERPPDAPDADNYVHLDAEIIRQQIEAGKFLVHEEVTTGKLYGVRSLEVRAVQGANRVCLIEADSVSEVRQMRDAGLDANYLFIGPEDLPALEKKLVAQLMANPPLGREVDEAAEELVARVRDEVEEGRRSDMFGQRCVMIDGDEESSYSRLLDCVSHAYANVVPLRKVWGYGRQLWDPACRVYGNKPLKVMVLGPAAAGKSTLCRSLSKIFNMPWVDAGQLLQAEIKAKTPLGLRAKKYIDATKTVPDDIFIQLVQTRLAMEDCMRGGWVMDGFPHSYGQISELESAGIVPDKVIFLEATHELLMNRVVFRKIDPVTQETYHVPNPDAEVSAMHEHMEPKDKEVASRLVERHDDSEENVRNRLKFWDQFYKELRRSYPDVSMTISGEGEAANIATQCIDFLKVEDTYIDSIHVVPSSSLIQLQYQLIRALKWRRRQLVQLRQHDGALCWVDLREMARNASSLSIQLIPSLYAEETMAVRAQPYSLQQHLLLFVDSPEPIQLLARVAPGPRSLVEDPVPPPPPPAALILVGPRGVGKSTLMRRLLAGLPDKMVRAPQHTSRPPTPAEKAAADNGEDCGFVFLEEDELGLLMEKDGLLIFTFEGEEEYVVGVAKETVSKLAKNGKMAVLEMSTEEAEEMRERGVEGHYVFIAPPSLADLDVRLRSSRPMEEMDLQELLMDARRQMERAAEPGAWDHVVVNTSEEVAFQSLKQVVSTFWPRDPSPPPHRLLLQDYSWALDAPHGILRHRMQHAASASAQVSLPRGRHVVAVRTDPDNVYALSLRSNTKFSLLDYGDILLKHCGEVSTHHYTGSYPVLDVGTWHLWCRQEVQLPPEAGDAVLFSCTVNYGDVEMAPFCELRLIDNDTLRDTAFVAGDIPPRKLPRNGKGYTVMALSHLTKQPLRGAEYRLSMSSQPAVTVTEKLSTAVAKFKGQYRTNKEFVLGRCLATSQVEDGLTAVVAEISSTPVASTGLVLRLLKIRGNKTEDVVYGKEEEEVASWSARDRIVVPAVPLPPCESGFFHCFQLSLDPEDIPFTGLLGGELPDVGIQWLLQLMANTDEPKMAFVEDESRERLYSKTVQEFNEKGPGGMKERPGRAANALAALQAPPPGSSLTEQGAEGQAAAVPVEPPLPVKPAKGGGEPLQLHPEKFTRVVPKSDAPTPFDYTIWQERIQSVKELLGAYKETTLPTFAAGRKQAQETRVKTGVNKASAFHEHRAAFITNLKKLEEQRAELARSYIPAPVADAPPTPAAAGGKK